MKSLNGIWNLSDGDEEYELEARIPGLVQKAIMKHGTLPDPCAGSNEYFFRVLKEKD